MKAVNPQMVILARESRGFTQTDLAQRLGMSQGFLSKIESGQKHPPEGFVSRLSHELGYHTPFFYQELDFRQLPLPFFRKRQSLSRTALNQITAAVNVRRQELKALLRSVDIPKLQVPQIALEEYGGSVELLAQDLRRRWHLPAGPVENVTQTLEAAGILVMQCDFASTRIYGLSMYGENDGLPPVIFVNPALPGDRWRWTLIHELLHIIAHNHLPFVGDECEAEANLFTQAFLMPAEDIRPHLTRLNLQRLASLKPHWKVAMQALIMRAATVGKISERQKRSLFAMMNKLGYRINEPVQIEREHPTLIDQVVRLHLDELGYSPRDLGHMIHLELEEFQRVYPITPKDSPPHLFRIK